MIKLNEIYDISSCHWGSQFPRRRTCSCGHSTTERYWLCMEIDYLDFTLFSDRQKGLESDTSLEDTIRHHAICINHLVNNVAVETSLTKQEATKTVWELAKADSTKV